MINNRKKNSKEFWTENMEMAVKSAKKLKRGDKGLNIDTFHQCLMAHGIAVGGQPVEA